MRRSPVFATYSETLSGLSSIRAYQQQDRFIANADQILDNSAKSYFVVLTSSRYIYIYSLDWGIHLNIKMGQITNMDVASYAYITNEIAEQPVLHFESHNSKPLSVTRMRGLNAKSDVFVGEIACKVPNSKFITSPSWSSKSKSI